MSKELEDIKKQVGRPLPAKASLLQIADHSLRLAHEKIKKLVEENQQVVKDYQDLGECAYKLKKANKKLKAKNKSLEETMKLFITKDIVPSWVKGKTLVEYNCLVSNEEKLTETEFNQIKEVIEKYGK